MTPLELAVWSGNSDIVYYFINKAKMDSTKFDQVTMTLTICVYVTL